jgi:N,N-dimethylformamidase
MAILNPIEETSAIIETTSSVIPAPNDSPVLIAATSLHNRSGRKISGGHFKEVLEPIELPEQTKTFNGKIDRPRLSNVALSKAEIESLASSYDECNTHIRSTVVAAWDFHANIGKNISSTKIVDTSPNNHHGFIINMPNRGMTGHNWTADEMVFHHKPVEYGAIHFHDDDIDDARWDVDFTLKVPENLKSGVYGARLRVDGREESEFEDYIPFCIKPPKGKATSKILFLLPTNSYMAYSNDNLGTNSVVAQL